MKLLLSKRTWISILILLTHTFQRLQLVPRVQSVFQAITDFGTHLTLGGKSGFVYMHDLDGYGLKPDGFIRCRGDGITRGMPYRLEFHVTNRFLLRKGMTPWVVDQVMTQALMQGHRPIFLEVDGCFYSTVGAPIVAETLPSFLYQRPLQAD